MNGPGGRGPGVGSAANAAGIGGSDDSTNVRAAAVLLGLASTAALSAWLLGQFAVSASDGREIADIALQAARMLPFLQLLAVSIVAPWLVTAAPVLAAAKSLMLFVLIPLPLQTLVVLAGPIDAGTGLLGVASVIGWSLLVLAAAALLRRARLGSLEPHAVALLQIGAAVAAWRLGHDWLGGIGVA